MKLLREFASWDCALHAIVGAVPSGLLAWAFGPVVILAAVPTLTTFGIWRELRQSLKDKTDPGKLSLKRWAEALSWPIGGILGVVLWAVIG